MEQRLGLPPLDLLWVELALSVVLTLDGGLLRLVVVGLTVRDGLVEDLLGQPNRIALQRTERKGKVSLSSRKERAEPPFLVLESWQNPSDHQYDKLSRLASPVTRLY